METTVPTPQEKFSEIYSQQEENYDKVKYLKAVEEFKELTGVQPPYKNYSSFKVMQSRKRKVI